MLIEPSSGICCRDDDSFFGTQQSGQTRRLVLPEHLDLPGLWVFAVCRPKTELALLAANTLTSEFLHKGSSVDYALLTNRFPEMTASTAVSSSVPACIFTT